MNVINEKTVKIKMDKEKEELILNNIPLIKKFVSSTFAKEKNPDHISDLISEGCAIICERINMYDPNISKFSTWVYNTLGLYLRSYYNRIIKQTNEFLLFDDGPLSSDNDPKTSATNLSIDNVLTEEELNKEKNDCPMETMVDIHIFREKFETLPEIDKKLLMMTVQGYTNDEIAKELNLTKKSQIFFRQHSALNKLRKLYHVRGSFSWKKSMRRFKD